jgi:hypothetical protein
MLDDELRALVSVNPSPDFQARVRTGISRAPARVRWLGMPAAALALAAMVVMAVAVALVFRTGDRRHESSPSPGLLTTTQATAEPAGLVPPVAAHGRPQPAPVSVSRRLADSRPDVQIDRAETRALHQLFASPIPIIIVDESEREPRGDVVIPSISIKPLTLDTRSEGDRQ